MTAIEIYYINDVGDEHVHVTNSWGLDIREKAFIRYAGLNIVATGLAVK